VRANDLSHCRYPSYYYIKCAATQLQSKLQHPIVIVIIIFSTWT